MDQNATPDQVADAGARFIAAVYSGASNTTLNNLRLHHFEKALSKVNFSLASLPPTAAAARQHSLRVFLQVQLWKGIAMDPKKGHSCSNSIDEDHYTSFDEEVDILNEQADMASDITPDDTDDDEEAYPRTVKIPPQHQDEPGRRTDSFGEEMKRKAEVNWRPAVSND
ncbi:hypothetical protein GE061_006826 [Apolygus lucorum]|uniref:Uncharacterized protein n=1 Tax=Apolygus lucorum TaxID=248454 RepID=A0A8S9WQ78_APOLU|nr:hypothetical protein GE061_006826 [Apolygus lucorum]